MHLCKFILNNGKFKGNIKAKKIPRDSVLSCYILEALKLEVQRKNMHIILNSFLFWYQKMYFKISNFSEFVFKTCSLRNFLHIAFSIVSTLYIKVIKGRYLQNEEQSYGLLEKNKEIGVHLTRFIKFNPCFILLYLTIYWCR